ncbi:hypothetical protein [Legionella impletisoli]|uniref:Uncharacterized protein n=1 Tax=Legionella impletisoli TaxID=343510 RepID=A0A917NDK4_9GAMM|nr:hypothetical protein [Legionella impletisoli]GGI92487.1 hypothetical protein GCM10007966_21420 [Legionella impletisoli]
MPFFVDIKRYMPSRLTPNTALYTRASFGAMAAYAATVNPIMGALVLLGHGAWECASLLLQSGIDAQQQRIERYNEAFLKLSARAKTLGSECSQEEIEKAKNIFFVHNLIEEICYQALADIVVQLGICKDEITEEQSNLILAHVKEAAHIELRKEGGYSKKGREMITAEQFNGVIRNITTIIHDRDGRLTDARYSTLTDLCIALDDHNTYVKSVLFRSWLRCEALSANTHLAMIKDIVHFNSQISQQVGFNFERKLAERKQYYSIHHHNIREVVCPKTGEKSALRFVHVTEVRAQFQPYVAELKRFAPDRPFQACLIEACGFSQEQIATLSSARKVSCPARFGFASSSKTISQPPLILCESLTVGEFLSRYFPEHDQTNASVMSLAN